MRVRKRGWKRRRLRPARSRELRIDEERVHRHQIVLDVGDVLEPIDLGVYQRVEGLGRELLPRAIALASAAEHSPEDADVRPVEEGPRQLAVGPQSLPGGEHRPAHLPHLEQHEVAHEEYREDVSSVPPVAAAAVVPPKAQRVHGDHREEAATLEPLEDEAHHADHVDVGVGRCELHGDGARL
eukprot:scaffold44728_cov58-Phaeocystis_antarctica.AAC.2